MLSLIVSLAILLNLFAPALGQAAATLTANPLALEICSATPLTVNPPDGQHAPGGLHAHALKHCMLCAVHAGDDAPPPVAAGLLTVLDGHDVFPGAHPAAPRQHARWPAAQPRGPPAGV